MVAAAGQGTDKYRRCLLFRYGHSIFFGLNFGFGSPGTPSTLDYERAWTVRTCVPFARRALEYIFLSLGLVDRAGVSTQ